MFAMESLLRMRLLAIIFTELNGHPTELNCCFTAPTEDKNTMEWTAASTETGKCRIVVHEEWLPSYTTNTPEIKFLNDNKRFVWQSERTGFKNYYLYDLSGKLLATPNQSSV